MPHTPDKPLTIVLAHPRTGSSMLMQTLGLLGAGVVGEFERSDLPQEANPRGYFEDRAILGKGLTDEAQATIAAHPADHLAVKLALTPMLKEKRAGQWQWLRDQGATILVPLRHPLETALSKMVFNPTDQKVERFRRITTFLRNYRLHIQRLARILNEQVPELLPNVHIVPHALAVGDPARYVERVAQLAKLDAGPKAQAAAIANIDPSLYRYRLADFSAEMREWDEKIGASALYEQLVGTEHPWRLPEEDITATT